MVLRNDILRIAGIEPHIDFTDDGGATLQTLDFAFLPRYSDMTKYTYLVIRSKR